MAWSAETHPTLIDIARLQDPNGGLLDTAEMLSQQNEMLPDMVMLQSNEALSHVASIRTGLPSGTWRRFNMGVQPSKSKTNQVRFAMGNYEAYAEVDRDECNLNGNSAAWRRQEEMPFVESMNQEMQKTIIYGNDVHTPGSFPGLVQYYNDVNETDNPSADNVIDAKGTGTDNRSIWLVVWGPATCFGIYPKGQVGGLQIKDKAEVTIEDVDGNGGRMEAYRTHYKWAMGLVVKDWRYAVRIANIDKSELKADASGSSANLPDLMFEAMERIPSLGMGRPAFYMSRDVRTKLRQQLANKVSGSTLTFADVGGRRTMMFQEMPLRRVDALATDEGRVT